MMLQVFIQYISYGLQGEFDNSLEIIQCHVLLRHVSSQMAWSHNDLLAIEGWLRFWTRRLVYEPRITASTHLLHNRNKIVIHVGNEYLTSWAHLLIMGPRH